MGEELGDTGNHVRGRSVFPPQWLKDHLPLALTAIVAAVVFLRLYFVSAGDTSTLRGLIEAAGPSSVLLGLAPDVLVTLISFGVGLVAGRTGSNQRRFPWYVDALVFASVVFFVPWTSALVLAGVAISLILVLPRLEQRRRSRPDDSMWQDRTFVIVLMVGVVVPSVLFRDTPWLPAEALYLTDGQVEIGYVVDIDNEWLTLLYEDDRSLGVMSSAAVSHRQVCRAQVERPSLMFRWRTRPAYPVCAELEQVQNVLDGPNGD